MRHSFIAVGVGLALAAATTTADARSRCEQYAHNRKVTGTVIGALGGGLLGSAVAGHGSKGTGALVGAGLGAVVGNNMARVSCDRYAVRRHHHHYARRTTYPHYAGPNYAPAAPAACHSVNRPYYDQAGRLVYAPMQVCE